MRVSYKTRLGKLLVGEANLVVEDDDNANVVVVEWVDKSKSCFEVNKSEELISFVVKHGYVEIYKYQKEQEKVLEVCDAFDVSPTSIGAENRANIIMCLQIIEENESKIDWEFINKNQPVLKANYDVIKASYELMLRADDKSLSKSEVEDSLKRLEKRYNSLMERIHALS